MSAEPTLVPQTNIPTTSGTMGSGGQPSAKPLSGRRTDIPKSWWVGLFALVLGLLVIFVLLATYGTQRDIEAAVGFAEILIAVFALFSIYLALTGRTSAG